LDWMRINAERERIKHYREIAQESAQLYYRVLKRITESDDPHLQHKENA